MDVVVLVVTSFILALFAPISQLHAFALGPAQSTQVERVTQIERPIDLRRLDFDYPVTLEPEVSSYINLFSKRRQNLMRGWLARMGLFEDVIYAELKDANCPLDLIAVAMIIATAMRSSGQFASFSSA